MVDKICLDSASPTALRSHQNIDYQLAKLMSRCFENNKLRVVEDLESQPFMDSENWKKIVPYLKICEHD